jgi:hypothetical protein
VQRIGWHSTVLESKKDGSKLIVPNSDVSTVPVTNLSRRERRVVSERIVLPEGDRGAGATRRALKELNKAIKTHPAVASPRDASCVLVDGDHRTVRCEYVVKDGVPEASMPAVRSGVLVRLCEVARGPASTEPPRAADDGDEVVTLKSIADRLDAIDHSLSDAEPPREDPAGEMEAGLKSLMLELEEVEAEADDLMKDMGALRRTIVDAEAAAKEAAIELEEARAFANDLQKKNQKLTAAMKFIYQTAPDVVRCADEDEYRRIRDEHWTARAPLERTLGRDLTVGEDIDVDVDLDAFVKDIQARIQREHGISVDEQRLFFEGKEMRDEDSIAKYAFAPALHLARGRVLHSVVVWGFDDDGGVRVYLGEAHATY